MKSEHPVSGSAVSKVLEISQLSTPRTSNTPSVASFLEEGFEQYYSRLYAYAIYRLQDLNLAHDIVSTSFTIALSRSDHFDPTKGTVDSWLFGIARNVIRKQLRARRIRKLLSLDSLSSHPPSSQRWVEDFAAENHLLAKLIPCIGVLPEREREILYLKFGGEMSNRDIAEVLGLTQSNVGVILYRTLHRLRDQLQQEVEDE